MEHTPDSVKPFLSREQHNLYRLIYTRFLASQMKPAVFQTMTADIMAMAWICAIMAST